MLPLSEDDEAKLRIQAKHQQEVEQWKAGLANQLAQSKIERKGVKSAKKIKKIKQNSQLAAQKVANAIDKGWKF